MTRLKAREENEVETMHAFSSVMLNSTLLLFASSHPSHILKLNTETLAKY